MSAEFRCLGCSQALAAEELSFCFEAHLERFDEATPIGPLCCGCIEAHRAGYQCLGAADHWPEQEFVQ